MKVEAMLIKVDGSFYQLLAEEVEGNNGCHLCCFSGTNCPSIKAKGEEVALCRGMGYEGYFKEVV